MKLTTTLNKIRKHDPCVKGWITLIVSLDKTKADDEPLDLMHVLKSNGINDAVWCLRCFDYRDYCLFIADMAESVLHIFEKKDPDDRRPRQAVDAIRDFHSGKITDKELPCSVFEGHYDDDDVAADVLFSVIRAAIYGANTSGTPVEAAGRANAAAVNKNKEIEKLFIKHFGSK